ncbi:MAG: hypothetical protein DRH50_06880 [Deltaproteobacteria bacterium]|nr:MAG: hypothetical protein DRH50_06880 [Deltaproteobacteria bacterium]
MRIWIDLTNSPHVNFFEHMIRELQREHEILLTCRPLANTIDLLELCGFSYHVVGKHYGQNKIKKIAGFIVRVLQLYWFLRNKDIDVSISHSSFYSPLVSRLLGIRCIYLNDNEYAGGNKISFIFADKIMIPEFLDVEKVKKQWAKEGKIIRYPGVKEGVYLWSYKPTISNSNNSGNGKSKKTIFIRPEPWTAQYYKGERNFIDELLIGIKNKYKIILLPRGKVQEKHYRQAKFSGIVVPEKSISLADIMSNCDLFIGAGGTMTREAAVLGIPTISIYQDELLDVDKYLIDKGFMIHKKDVDAKFVMNFLGQMDKRPPDKQLLDKGKEAYELIKNTLLSADYTD